ncbi:8619_t:CDS:1, partial [Ambispora gerdemannii]
NRKRFVNEGLNSASGISNKFSSFFCEPCDEKGEHVRDVFVRDILSFEESY